MGIFDRIKDAIFHRAAAAPAQPAPAPTAGTTPAAAPPTTNAAPSGASPEPQAPGATAPAPAPSSPSAAPQSGGASPAQGVDVAAILDKAVRDSGQKLEWRHSVVDTMKALGLDSSLGERKELAMELGYTGDTGDSAAMNVWLQKALMRKLAENGGTVPAELRD